jgi:hypothetical protein
MDGHSQAISVRDRRLRGARQEVEMNSKSDEGDWEGWAISRLPNEFSHPQIGILPRPNGTSTNRKIDAVL